MRRLSVHGDELNSLKSATKKALEDVVCPNLPQWLTCSATIISNDNNDFVTCIEVWTPVCGIDGKVYR